VGLRNQPNPIKHLEKRKRKIFGKSSRQIRKKKKKKKKTETKKKKKKFSPKFLAKFKKKKKKKKKQKQKKKTKQKNLIQNKTEKESINNLQVPISSSTHYSQNRQSTLKSTRNNQASSIHQPQPRSKSSQQSLH
jgi:hypothetical protein